VNSLIFILKFAKSHNRWLFIRRTIVSLKKMLILQLKIFSNRIINSMSCILKLLKGRRGRKNCHNIILTRIVLFSQEFSLRNVIVQMRIRDIQQN
jgi:hypothetical protein